MKPLLGISVGASHVCAVLWWRDAIRWAGAAPYTGPEALADAIARLTAEAGMPVRRARVVLEREVVQLRTIVPAPPLGSRALRSYVALEAPRLFRRNGAPIVTDGVRVAVKGDTTALWAGAVVEPLVQAVVAGCAQAGLSMEGLGPAADVLAGALREPGTTLVFPNGGTSEVLEVGTQGPWRSRLVTRLEEHQGPALAAPLDALGADATHFAAAYAAAIAVPRLSLFPPDVRRAHERSTLQRLARLCAIGAVLWGLAGVVYVGRLSSTRHRATRALGAAAGAVDTALAVRRQLGMAQATLATVADAERARSRHVALLAAVTRALGDSTYLVAFQITSDGTLRLAGYAPVAARVVADLERVPGLRDVRLEGPISREQGAGSTERDRFAIVARLEVGP